MTDNTAAIRTDFDRPAPGVIKGFQALATILAKAQAKAAADAATSLDEWEKKHRAGVEAALLAKGYRA